MKIKKDYLKQLIKEEIEAAKTPKDPNKQLWQKLIMNQEFVDLSFNYLMDLKTGESTGWNKLKKWLSTKGIDDRSKLERIRRNIKIRYTPYIEKLATFHPSLTKQSKLDNL